MRIFLSKEGLVGGSGQNGRREWKIVDIRSKHVLFDQVG